MSRYTYYEDQLNRINFKHTYKATVSFRDSAGQSNHMDVNEDSARAIAAKLIKEFNIIPSGQAVAEMQIDEMWVAFGNFCQAMNDQMKKP